MKRLFLIMAIAIAASLQVSAQKNNNQQMTAQHRTEQRIKLLDEKLSLTEEQKTKLRELYSDFNKQKYPREKRKEDERHCSSTDNRTTDRLQTNGGTGDC